MPGFWSLRIWIFVCLNWMIQERTVFRNIGFLHSVFLWILDHTPIVLRDWFFWIFVFGFSLDRWIRFLFGYWCSCESINLTYTNILLKNMKYKRTNARFIIFRNYIGNSKTTYCFQGLYFVFLFAAELE